MGEERNFEFFIGDCQFPAVVSPESTIWLLPADTNEEEVSGSIKKYVDKALNQAKGCLLAGMEISVSNSLLILNAEKA